MLHRFEYGTEPMGDFVEKKVKDTAPSLFELIPGGADYTESQRAGGKIQDFMLLTASESDIVEERITAAG
jgi:hypothetical protein